MMKECLQNKQGPLYQRFKYFLPGKCFNENFATLKADGGEVKKVKFNLPSMFVW